MAIDPTEQRQRILDEARFASKALIGMLVLCLVLGALSYFD